MKRILLALALLASQAASAHADTPEIDYIRRVFLPAGHAMGIAYNAEPTAAAFYVTRAQSYSLNLDTGVFSLVQNLPQPNPVNSTATYTSSLNGDNGFLHFSNGTGRSLTSYNLLTNVTTFNQAMFALDLFGQGANTLYFLSPNPEIYSYSWNGTLGTANLVYTSGDSLETFDRFYIQDNIATVLTQRNSTVFGIDQIDLTTGTLINSFAMAETFPNIANSNSLTVDSEGNIYVGNNLGGAYVYDTTGQLLTSFVPGAVNPTDPNLGTNSHWMFLNTDGDLLVMDDTGLHQYQVVPEPGTLALAGAGLMGLFLTRRRSSSVSRQT